MGQDPARALREHAQQLVLGRRQLDAVGVGQHQVEQDQPGLLGPDEARQLPGVAGDQRGVARRRQRVADLAQRLRVVVDHQDGHRFRCVARRAGAGPAPDASATGVAAAACAANSTRTSSSSSVNASPPAFSTR